MSLKKRIILFFRLLLTTRPFIGELVVSVMLGAAAISSGIGLLGTSAYLIARAALHPSIAVLQVAIVGVRFFGLTRAVFRYLERLVSHSVNFRLLSQIRVWFYRSLEPLVPACLYDLHSGDLLDRIIGDIEILENFYIRVISPPAVAVIVTTGLAVFMHQFDDSLVVILILGLACSGILLPVIIYSLSKPHGGRVINLASRLNSQVIDGVQGYKDITAFGNENTRIESAISISQGLCNEQFELHRFASWGNAVNLLLSNFSLLCVMVIAIPWVNSGKIDGWNLAVLCLVTLASFEATTPMALTAQTLEKSLQAAGRLFDLVDVSPAIKAPDQPVEKPGVLSSIEFKDIHFRYTTEQYPVLTDINLLINRGQRIGIVGPNGSGKTSLVNMLLRFWDYQHGKILLNGVDIHQFAPEDVRSLIGVVAQNSYIFSGSLKQNLQLVKPDATEEEMIEVLDKVGLSQWQSGLPNGICTWIGEQGVQLSGGERQRLVIAQVLLRNCPLIILDEPLSHLDEATSQKLHKTLLEITSQRSSIWISHRLDQMVDMDQIYVLKNGKVIEAGNHQALVDANGFYSHWWKIQDDALKGLA